jgi:hypothetical protein
MGDHLMHVLAHAGGHTLGQNSVETLLLLASAGLALAAVRVRGVRIFGRPGLASWAVGMLAVAALALAFVVPSRLGTKIASVRPSTNAEITILSPRPHQVLRGNPAAIRVRLRVTGARIVTQTSTHLSPDKGHVHLYLDGMLAAMAYATSTTIYASPGRHRLEAQFVAVDHGPFSPPVTASVTFRVIP